MHILGFVYNLCFAMHNFTSLAHPSFVIPPEYRDTPLLHSSFLSTEIHGQVVIKDETCTPIGSFKARGAFHFCARKARPGMQMVCASAGNFGQGMAVAARMYGCQLTVFASNRANPAKVDRMRELGAEVALYGSDFDEAKDAARHYATTHNLLFVEDGAEDEITEGASSLGYEICNARPDVSCVVLPLGNGALICGVARAFEASGSTARIIGVVAAAAPAMARSWRTRSIVSCPAKTIADGIGVRAPVPQIMPEVYDGVDEVLEVSESHLKTAIKKVFVHHGIVTEPTGAAGAAALLAFPERFKGHVVATALCGGNISPDLRAELFESKELVI
jgi:threonine dehydratase